MVSVTLNCSYPVAPVLGVFTEFIGGNGEKLLDDNKNSTRYAMGVVINDVSKLRP